VNWRLVGALLLATWPLSTPAFADVRQDSNLIQFSYQWGRIEQTFTDASVTVTVTNNITNKIGGNGEVIDTYRITLGAQVIEVREKHDARAYTFEIVGTQALVLEGIDNGFWGGYYGPIMQVESVPLAPVTESPSVSPDVSESPTVSPTWAYSVDEGNILEVSAPANMVFSGVTAGYVAHEGDCGLDVSAILSPIFIGTNMASVSATNDVFGDPCPGWYKKLVANFEYAPASESQQVTQSATLSPEPEVQPTPLPLPEPSPSPEPSQPEPTPTLEPSPEPTASSPTKSPEPEQTESPTLSEPIPTPTSTQSESEPVVPETTSPEPQVLPTIVPSPQSSEEPSEEPSSPATQAPEVPEETESDSVSGTIETAVSEAIGAAVEAVGELVQVFASAGLDMTPEQREEAQDVVVSTIIVSQVASAASSAAVSARKIK
jgi:hypothetical protein